MATTIIKNYTKREPKPDFNMKDFLEVVQEAYAVAQGDEDKAGDIEDAAFYEGNAHALKWVLEQLTVEPKNPMDEVELYRGQPISKD